MEPEVRKWVKDLDLKAPTPAEIVEALPEDIVKALLEAKDEPPIVWSRLTDLQDVSMRLIAERLLKQPERKQPERKYMMKHTITERVREHYHVDDKTGKKKLQLKNKRDDCEFNLYVSEFLPKRAHDIATWLVDNIEGFKVCSKGNCEQLKKCEHILVHLSAKTWEDRRFVHEVCESMREGVHRLLVWEVPGYEGIKPAQAPYVEPDNPRHAVTFETIKKNTEKCLEKLSQKCYGELAMEIGTGEWYECGLQKLAAELCGSFQPRFRGRSLLAAAWPGEKNNWVINVKEPEDWKVYPPNEESNDESTTTTTKTQEPSDKLKDYNEGYKDGYKDGNQKAQPSLTA